MRQAHCCLTSTCTHADATCTHSPPLLFNPQARSSSDAHGDVSSALHGSGGLRRVLWELMLRWSEEGFVMLEDVKVCVCCRAAVVR